MYPYMQLAITDRGTFPPPPPPPTHTLGGIGQRDQAPLCAVNTNMGGEGVYLCQSMYVDEISKYMQRKLPMRCFLMSIGKMYTYNDIIVVKKKRISGTYNEMRSQTVETVYYTIFCIYVKKLTFILTS